MTMMPIEKLGAIFVAGVVYELLFVAWAVCVERRWPLRGATMTMLLATVSILGFGAAIRSSTSAAIAWVLGNGLGAFLAIIRKPRHKTDG